MSPSWEEFVGSFRGPSYLSPLVDELDHPAASPLSKWRDEGVPVQTTIESWTAEQKDEGIARGCHHSANEHADFPQEEMADNIENKFWMVLPHEQVQCPGFPVCASCVTQP